MTMLLSVVGSQRQAGCDTPHGWQRVKPNSKYVYKYPVATTHRNTTKSLRTFSATKKFCEDAGLQLPDSKSIHDWLSIQDWIRSVDVGDQILRVSRREENATSIYLSLVFDPSTESWHNQEGENKNDSYFVSWLKRKPHYGPSGAHHVMLNVLKDNNKYYITAEDVWDTPIKVRDDMIPIGFCQFPGRGESAHCNLQSDEELKNNDPEQSISDEYVQLKAGSRFYMTNLPVSYEDAYYRCNDMGGNFKSMDFSRYSPAIGDLTPLIYQHVTKTVSPGSAERDLYRQTGIHGDFDTSITPKRTTLYKRWHVPKNWRETTVLSSSTYFKPIRAFGLCQYP